MNRASKCFTAQMAVKPRRVVMKQELYIRIGAKPLTSFFETSSHPTLRQDL